MALLLGSSAAGYMLTPSGFTGVRTSSNVKMIFGKINENEPGDPTGQVQRFQDGQEFLFFQSPAPLTSGEFFEAADPPPNFFSAENFQDLQITGTQIGVTVTGVGAAVALAGLLVTA